MSPFSSRVDEAHDTFMSEASRAGATTRTFDHPLKGPHGEALATGVAMLGPVSAKNVVLITSGVHGVEGYAGSAVQIEYLRNFSAARLEPETSIVLVHMVNPWGAAWDRRENEDNVDVFRNFLYCAPPYADNPTYKDLDDAINPAAWVGPIREAADRRLNEFIRTQGMNALVATFRRGQHFNPRGLTYHGQGPVWSKLMFDEVAVSFLSQARSIVSVDVHTGFGELGEGLVVIYKGQSEEKVTFAEQSYGPLYIPGADAVIPTHGAMPFDCLERDGRRRVHSIGLEFGTYDLAAHIDVFREANFVFAHDDPTSTDALCIRAKIRELLYPASDAWRSAVLARGCDVLMAAERAAPRWAALAPTKSERA